MAAINTTLPFTHLLFEKSGWRGIPLDVLVVRGTYDLGKDGKPMSLAAEQSPLQFGDVFDGAESDPLNAVLKADGDLVVGKIGTDIILSGHLHSPNATPVPSWIAGVRIGTLSKGLRVTGPRKFKRTLFGWRIGPAAPVTSVPLDYRLAFGGRAGTAAHLGQVYFDANPAGIGWLPTNADMKQMNGHEKRAMRKWIRSQKQLQAPQFEDHLAPIRKPTDRVQPQGFGAIARWWQPRRKYQGTLDEKWRAEQYPNPPDDYDPRFTSNAHPELISEKYLQGDEKITLAQCLPDGQLQTALPGHAVHAMTCYANGSRLIVPLALDTVRINLDNRQCVLVWRTIFDRTNPPTAIDIIALPLVLPSAAGPNSMDSA